MIKVRKVDLKEIRFFIDHEYTNNEKSIFFKCRINVESSINLLGIEGDFNKTCEIDLLIEMNKDYEFLLKNLWEQIQEEVEKEVSSK